MLFLKSGKTQAKLLAKRLAVALCLPLLAMLTSCQTDVVNAGSFTASSQLPISEVMPLIARQSSKCLVGKGKLFPDLRASSELNSLSGKPRVLLVDKRNARGLPLLVFEGQSVGSGTQLNVFGAALNSANAAAKIHEAVGDWAAGKSFCD